jgi:hypothetical protein
VRDGCLEDYPFEKVDTVTTQSNIGFVCQWEKAECEIFKATKDIRKVRRAMDRLRHINIVLEEWAAKPKKGAKYVSFVWDQTGDIIDQSNYLFLPAIYIVWKRTVPSPVDSLAQHMETMTIEELHEDKNPDSHMDIDGLSKAMECVVVNVESPRRSDSDDDSIVGGLPPMDSLEEEDF